MIEVAKFKERMGGKNLKDARRNDPEYSCFPITFLPSIGQ
jgi:hypothetical protein